MCMEITRKCLSSDVLFTERRLDIHAFPDKALRVLALADEFEGFPALCLLNLLNPALDNGE